MEIHGCNLQYEIERTARNPVIKRTRIERCQPALVAEQATSALGDEKRATSEVRRLGSNVNLTELRMSKSSVTIRSKERCALRHAVSNVPEVSGSLLLKRSSKA